MLILWADIGEVVGEVGAAYYRQSHPRRASGRASHLRRARGPSLYDSLASMLCGPKKDGSSWSRQRRKSTEARMEIAGH
jgi:hypothetical protein